MHNLCYTYFDSGWDLTFCKRQMHCINFLRDVISPVCLSSVTGLENMESWQKCVSMGEVPGPADICDARFSPLFTKKSLEGCAIIFSSETRL